ncbi:hypothetical protein V2J09_019876 [Rumex salicifolius]
MLLLKASKESRNPAQARPNQAKPSQAMLTYYSLIYMFVLVAGVMLCRAKIPALIVFGDSTVDPGNNNYIPCLLKSDFPPYGRDLPGGRPTGRFSNGRIPPDYLAEALGLHVMVPAYLDPSKSISDLAVAVSFASAGTGYDNATAAILNVLPLWKEVEYYKEYQGRLKAYLGSEKANYIIREGLYLVSIGTNDFLVNYDILPTRKAQYTLDEYADFLLDIAEKFIRDIYGVGARKVLYTGLGPIGCVPLERTINLLGDHACRDEYNTVAKTFNLKLHKLLFRLNAQLPGITLVLSNPFQLVQQLVKHPDRYGFEDTSKACCGTGSFELSFLCNKDTPFTCADADKYIFWDSFHPTDKANRIISEYVTKNYLTLFLG